MLAFDVGYNDRLPEGSTCVIATLTYVWSGETTAGVLRLRKLPRAVVESLRQVQPIAHDLTGLCTAINELDDDYPITLDGERRVIELRLAVVAEPPGDQIRVARLAVLVDDRELTQHGLIVAWESGMSGMVPDDGVQASEPTMRTSGPAGGPPRGDADAGGNADGER
jgi:hypothetical protein